MAVLQIGKLTSGRGENGFRPAQSTRVGGHSCTVNETACVWWAESELKLLNLSDSGWSVECQCMQSLLATCAVMGRNLERVAAQHEENARMEGERMARVDACFIRLEDHLERSAAVQSTTMARMEQALGENSVRVAQLHLAEEGIGLRLARLQTIWRRELAAFKEAKEELEKATKEIGRAQRNGES